MQLPDFISNISIVDILSIIAVICVIVFLVKKAVGLAIAIIAILVIFQIGFNFTGANVKDSADKYLDPGTSNAVTSFLDDFAKRRDENGVVDTKQMYNSLVDAAGKTVEFAGDVITPDNIGKLADGIGDALKSAGVKDISVGELSKIIADRFEKSIDDIEVQELVQRVEEQMSYVDVTQGVQETQENLDNQEG